MISESMFLKLCKEYPYLTVLRIIDNSKNVEIDDLLKVIDEDSIIEICYNEINEVKLITKYYTFYLNSIEFAHLKDYFVCVLDNNQTFAKYRGK